jgi:plastocyanin
MNSLDSRLLRLGDTFTQKFTTAGTVRYHLGPAASLIGGESYTIEVKPDKRSGKPQQHQVKVSLKQRHLSADPPKLEIHVGEAVMWHAADTKTPGFGVSGEHRGGSFSSAALAQECVYSHAFGVAGEYDWVDANGGGLTGKVVVKDPFVKTDSKKSADYQKKLSQGTIIVIRRDRVEPKQVEVVTGQTVFWAVERADGISVTDIRLIDKAYASRAG